MSDVMTKIGAVAFLAAISFAAIVAWLLLVRVARSIRQAIRPARTDTIILFYGRSRNQADQWQISSELAKQSAEENARKKNIGSVTSVWCLPDGELKVDVRRIKPPGEPMWEGIVGRVPKGILPGRETWTIQDYLIVEPAARAIVENALSSGPTR